MDSPPKRRAPASAPPPTAAKKPRQSKLAKENNLTAAEESEIKEAYTLFADPTSPHDLPTASVRRALLALNLSCTPSELSEIISALDPEDEGFVQYENFVAVAALKLKSRSEGDVQGEVEEAFGLFFAGEAGKGKGREASGFEGQRIGIRELKRVAALLKEDISEEVLRDMVLEANGGRGVGVGVGLEEFEGVMRRAGMFR